MSQDLRGLVLSDTIMEMLDCWMRILIAGFRGFDQNQSLSLSLIDRPLRSLRIGPLSA